MLIISLLPFQNLHLTAPHCPSLPLTAPHCPSLPLVLNTQCIMFPPIVNIAAMFSSALILFAHISNRVMKDLSKYCNRHPSILPLSYIPSLPQLALTSSNPPTLIVIPLYLQLLIQTHPCLQELLVLAAQFVFQCDVKVETTPSL